MRSLRLLFVSVALRETGVGGGVHQITGTGMRGGEMGRATDQDEIS